MKTSPWYKQFWPWFLILVPLISVMLSINLLRLAINTDDSLVVDDYYKEGKSINANLARQKQAQVLGIRTNLQIDGTAVKLTPLSELPQPGAALTLDFYHPTLEKKDLVITLLADANGNYRAQLPRAIQGKWYVSLTPHDDSWKVQKTLYINTNKTLETNFSAE